MSRRTLFAFALAALATVGCAVDTEESASSGNSAVKADPDAMPGDILSFLSLHGWGNHHLEWHMVRNWDVMGKDGQDYAKEQGWSRCDLQEGAVGNGLEFLAMHRAMIAKLKSEFPKDANLFEGFSTPPRECSDEADPCGPDSHGTIDPSKAAAIDKLENHLADFKDDDEFGLYIETSMRPTAADPQARSKDKSVGIHNYLHNRFMVRGSPIDVGQPQLNLQNRKFWRLHGWIESRWTAFRKLKGFSDKDPTYQAALKKGAAMFEDNGGIKAVPQREVPASVREFFANKD